jgi:hypothetical protein
LKERARELKLDCAGGQKPMKSYSYSERGNFATVLDEAERREGRERG